MLLAVLQLSHLILLLLTLFGSTSLQGFDRVKAVGVGHSWWKEQFCAGDSDKSINIVLTEL